MNHGDLATLLSIADRKQAYDQGATWSEGSRTYLRELRNEVTELEAEIGKGRTVHLEDELADVLRDYLNLVKCLEREEKISLAAVLTLAIQKYEERISGIEQGESWQDIKSRQREYLANAQATRDRTS